MCSNALIVANEMAYFLGWSAGKRIKKRASIFDQCDSKTHLTHLSPHGQSLHLGREMHAIDAVNRGVREARRRQDWKDAPPSTTLRLKARLSECLGH